MTHKLPRSLVETFILPLLPCPQCPPHRFVIACAMLDPPLLRQCLHLPHRPVQKPMQLLHALVILLQGFLRHSLTCCIGFVFRNWHSRKITKTNAKIEPMVFHTECILEPTSSSGKKTEKGSYFQ